MIKTLGSYIPGFALAFLIGNMALLLSPHLGVPATLLALFSGLALSPFYTKGGLKTGVNWSSGFVLRVGVAFLGFRIAFDDLLTLGLNAALMIVLAISMTILIGILCARALGLRKEFGALTGGAISICGASAAMAIASVLPDYKDKSRDLSLAVMGITAFSTLEMIVYPWLGPALGLNVVDMGMFLGGTIHDVAQTAGAGYSVSEEVGDMAVLTKMIRVAFILPVVFVLMLAFKARRTEEETQTKFLKTLPFFLFAFFAFMILNSIFPLPPELGSAIGQLSKIALITAIAAIGIKTNIKDIMAVGFRPFFLIAIEAVSIGAIILLWICTEM